MNNHKLHISENESRTFAEIIKALENVRDANRYNNLNEQKI